MTSLAGVVSILVTVLGAAGSTTAYVNLTVLMDILGLTARHTKVSHGVLCFF